MSHLNVILLTSCVLMTALSGFAQSDEERLKEIKAYFSKDVYSTNEDSLLLMADKGIEFAGKLDDASSLIYFIGQKGTIKSQFSKYPEALELYQDAIKLAEEKGLEHEAAYMYNSMGSIHRQTGNDEASLEYHRKAERIYIDNEDSAGLASVYNNIGIHYMLQAKYDTGMAMWGESMKIKLALGDEQGAATTMNNMAMYYRDIGKTELAMSMWNRVMKIDSAALNYEGLSLCATNIGELYLKQSDSTKAYKYYRLGLELARQSKSYLWIRHAWAQLAFAYKHFEDYKLAYHALEQFYVAQDSMMSKENQAQMAELEERFGSEKKAMEIEKLEGDKKRQTLQNIALAIGLGLALILGLVMLRSYRQKKKSHDIIAQQKEEVELQKMMIEEKNHEILDSINYAKRLQGAILPTKDFVSERLPDSFILYMPKDIVAGDFYWMDEIDGTTLFAVADCTGHGVPGAMVSVVCANALDRCVRELRLQKPSDILDEARRIVIEHFNRSAEDVYDGMDIALFSIHGMNVQFAGAHNPLVVIRDGELMEFRADKQPVGKYDAAKPFTNHELQLQPGDTLYMFTDGYVDQFGGARGKKMKSQPFKELLVSLQDHGMEDQREMLEESFIKWRGELAQIDDVCVVGVRV